MNTNIKSCFILSFLILFFSGYCSAEMKGLSETQLKGFVGSGSMSKEIQLTMGRNEMSAKQLNDLSLNASNSIPKTISVPEGKAVNQLFPLMAEKPPKPKLSLAQVGIVEISGTQESTTQSIGFSTDTVSPIYTISSPLEMGSISTQQQNIRPISNSALNMSSLANSSGVRISAHNPR